MPGATPGVMPGAYDEVAYPGFIYAQTHPQQLEVIGRLFGLRPPPASACRVLEVGCGDGVNALAVARALPGARVVGIDRAASAVERGRGQRAAAGLNNIELLVEDLADTSLAERLGGFDYVIAHGVFSWVPPAARSALLALTRAVLAPEGIAFVSYNAYPGSYLRDMARDVLEYHLRGVAPAQARIGQAHELMQAIVSIESPSPYARVLREQLQRMLEGSDALLYHDELAEVSTPFYFHEFIEQASSHGLQFLSEASLSDSQMREVPAGVAALMAALPPEAVVREQYLDFFRNRMFRQTLLVHSELEVTRQLDGSAIEGLWLSSPAQLNDGAYVVDAGGSVETTDPLVTAVLDELGAAWPGALRFDELIARTLRRLGQDSASLPGERREQLRVELLELYLVHVVQLSSVVSIS